MRSQVTDKSAPDERNAKIQPKHTLKKHHIMNEETLENYAYENGLEIVTVTRGTNGYPRGLHKAIIGFETYDEAEEAARRTNGRIVALSKRDGHDFWTGNDTAYGPLEINETFYPFEEYDIIKQNQEKEWWRGMIEELTEIWRDHTPEPEDTERMISKLKEIYQKIEDLADNEQVIIHKETLDFEIEPVKKMRHHDEDVTTYAIGVKYKEY